MIGPKDRGGCIGCLVAIALSLAVSVAAVVGAVAGLMAVAGRVLAGGW